VQALELAERLRAKSIEVWIDLHGIEAATSWSNEIVQAIDQAKAILVLLSASSIESDNVTRELSLAFEAKKAIMPIDIEPIALPTQFRYQLAGIQRAQLSDFDGIVRSLNKLGITGNNAGISPMATSIVPHSLSVEKSYRRLAVLPFEDLSPGKDHDWFSDGLTYELIDTLSGLSSLFVIDRQTAHEYKNSTLKSKQIATELDVRYIVTGGVRKASNNIRISATLVDTVDGTTLWNFKQGGVMDDIFDIQERVAKEISAGLLLTLTPSESKRIEERQTENAEAYELYLQAMHYDNRNTKQDTLIAIQLGEQAVALDPQFVVALASLGNSYLGFYRNYDRSEKWLDLAKDAIEKALELKPESAHTQSMLGIYYIFRKDSERAIAASKKGVELEPNNWLRWFHLGFTYMVLGMPKEAAEAYEEALARNPETLPGHFNLAIMYDGLDDHENAKRASERALPYLEKFVTRHPDDQTQRLSYSTLLYLAGKVKEAIEEAESILLLPAVDGNSYYNLACIFLAVSQTDRALQLFEKSIDTGFRNIDVFKNTIYNEYMKNDPTSRERYAKLIEKLEAKITEESKPATDA
jgi:TolB-like protein/Flp pilus assembly protein TadD